MQIAQTNKTVEGLDIASYWLEENRDLIPSLRETLQEYYRKHGRSFPWREVKDPYRILVAEILLQKTAAGPVEAVWTTLVTRYPDASALATAPPEDLVALIRPLGLIGKRIRALKGAADVITYRGAGQIRPDADFLKSLPGVGAYVRDAILSFAFDIPVAIIDANAARVYSRIGGFTYRTLRQGLAFASVVGEHTVSQETHKAVNYGVLDLAAQICKPKPLCDVCPLLEFCAYGRATTLVPNAQA